MKMRIYPLLGKVIMFTLLMGVPLIFAVPVLLLFKIDTNIVWLVAWAAILNIGLYAILSIYRDNYTTNG